MGLDPERVAGKLRDLADEVEQEAEHADLPELGGYQMVEKVADGDGFTIYVDEDGDAVIHHKESRDTFFATTANSFGKLRDAVDRHN